MQFSCLPPPQFFCFPELHWYVQWNLSLRDRQYSWSFMALQGLGFFVHILDFFTKTVNCFHTTTFITFLEQYGMPTKSAITFWEYLNMQASVLEVFHTFIFNIKWMIESAFYGKQAILHCARIKSQLQHWLTTGNAFFMRNQLQTIGTIVLLTHIQFKKFRPVKEYSCVYSKCIPIIIHCTKK